MGGRRHHRRIGKNKTRQIATRYGKKSTKIATRMFTSGSNILTKIAHSVSQHVLCHSLCPLFIANFVNFAVLK